MVGAKWQSRKMAVAGVVVLLAALMAFAPAPASAVDDVVEVIMKNIAFQPKELTIPVGTTVRFVNDDVLAHDVVQARPDQVRSGKFGFNSPQLNSGDSWEFTFEEAGVYPILCTTASHYLLGMTATITVE